MSAVSLPGSEHLGLAAVHPTLRDVGVFLGLPPAAARAMSASTALSTPLRKSAALRALGSKAAARFVKGSTGGPDAAQRARSTHTMVAEARSASGEVLATVTLTVRIPRQSGHAHRASRHGSPSPESPVRSPRSRKLAEASAR